MSRTVSMTSTGTRTGIPARWESPSAARTAVTSARSATRFTRRSDHGQVHSVRRPGRSVVAAGIWRCRRQVGRWYRVGYRGARPAGRRRHAALPGRRPAERPEVGGQLGIGDAGPVEAAVNRQGPGAACDRRPDRHGEVPGEDRPGARHHQVHQCQPAAPWHGRAEHSAVEPVPDGHAHRVRQERLTLMGLAIDTVLLDVHNASTNAAALTAATAANGDSLAVRYFKDGYACLTNLFMQGTTPPRQIRITSPRLHDNVTGLTIQPLENPTEFMFPPEWPQPLVAK